MSSLRRFAATKLRDHQPNEAETSLHQWIWLASSGCWRMTMYIGYWSVKIWILISPSKYQQKQSERFTTANW